MTNSKPAPGTVPNPNYSQEDWDEVSDNPEMTDAEIAELRPSGEGLPVALAEAFRRLGVRPKSEAKAVPVSLRVPPDVLAAYKADGPGWQTRMNEALAAGLRGWGVGMYQGSTDADMMHLLQMVEGRACGRSDCCS